jgi:hypothetical protein
MPEAPHHPRVTGHLPEVKTGGYTTVRPNSPTPDEPRITRRKFIRNVAAGGIGAVGAAKMKHENPNLPSLDNIISKINPYIGEKETYQGPELFEIPEVNEIVHELDIRPKNFMHEHNALPDNYSAQNEEQLLPIYPPLVLSEKNREIIYTLADKFGINPNIIATLMTVRTLGASKLNPRNEYGPFALPKHEFPDDLPKSDYENDEISSDLAVHKLKQKLDLAKKFREDPAEHYSQNDVIRSIMAFDNEDPALIQGVYNAFTRDQKEQYHQIASLLHTAEIASRLRQKDFTDQKIITALVSGEIDKRCWALEQNRKLWEQNDEVVLDILSLENVPSDARNAEERPLLATYHEEKPHYILPLNPGLRRMNAIRTDRLYSQAEGQNKISDFNDINTQNPLLPQNKHL